MGKTSYCFNDYVKDLLAASITLTSEDTNYPTENLQDEQIALTTRTTAKVGIKLQFTLSAAKSIQFFCIGNHNFNAGTYDIYSYTAADFTTGQIAVETNKAIRLLDTYHRESSSPASRLYWELDFTNAASLDSHFEFGRIMLYDDLVQITDIERETKARGYGFRNIINESPYGVRAAIHKLAEKRERFSLHWSASDSVTLATELRTLYESVYGDANPFVFIPDLSATNCYYCYLESPELFYNEVFGLSGQTGEVNLSLIEAVRGKV